MHHLTMLAGISWDPGIRGILVVAVGVAVLCGSVYLLLGTNVGARLGLLVALTGLFGWMVILTFVWWLTPPANGPRGNNASWDPVEIYVDGPETPLTEEVGELIHPSDLPSADQILADHPELADEYPNGFVLSDLEASHPEIVDQYVSSEQLNGWRLISSANAGESQAAAGAEVVDAGLFADTTGYKLLNTWEYGGKETRAEACPDDGLACRAWYRIRKSFQLKHPTHFAVVQLQAVTEQEAVPGEPPPLPVVDESAPVISVVLVRDLGDVRLIPFLYFIISLALFIITVTILHNRDKTLMKNREAAEALTKES